MAGYNETDKTRTMGMIRGKLYYMILKIHNDDVLHYINTAAVVLKFLSRIDIFNISREISLSWLPHNLTDV